MHAAAEHTKLASQDVNGSVVDAAVDTLIHDASDGGEDAEGDDVITRERFRGIFTRHPDMLVVFENQTALSERREVASSERDNMDGEEEIEENEQVWVNHLLTHFRNRWIDCLWIGLYIAGKAVAFSYKAIKYARNDDAIALFGNCIVVARGCAAALNFNAFLALLMMCRHFMTLLHKTPLSLRCCAGGSYCHGDSVRPVGGISHLFAHL